MKMCWCTSMFVGFSHLHKKVNAMPIQSQRYELVPWTSGFKARFYYTFDDQRIAKRGPVKVASEVEAAKLLTSYATDILAKQELADSEEAVTKGIYTRYRQASQKQVYLAYVAAAKDTTDPLEVYDLLKDLPTDERDVEATRLWELLKMDDSTFTRIKMLKAQI